MLLTDCPFSRLYPGSDLHTKALKSHWKPRADLTGAPAGAWRSWLQETGSLTQRLQSEAKHHFAVRILYQGIAPLSPTEKQWLNLKAQWAWVRQVQLEVDGQPWVFARSLLPLGQRSQLAHRLTHLGSQALGQLLFTSPQIRRGPLYFCAPGQKPFARLWGRASCFYTPDTQKAPLRLLVAEHFLPSMAARLKLPLHGIKGEVDR